MVKGLLTAMATEYLLFPPDLTTVDRLQHLKGIAGEMPHPAHVPQ